MTRMSHDLFVRNAATVGGCHEARTQFMQADRLCQRAFQSGFGSAFKQDL